jgi:arginyl-tRNA synthetase
LRDSGVAVEDDGAICIFVGKKKAPPLMIQKSNGGHGYATTDLAALRHRVNECKCDRIVYVTDVGQEMHFKQIFDAGALCKIVDPKKVQLDHMKFGMVLQENVSIDEDGKEVKKIEKIKTRAGKSVKLLELLDEAKQRALVNFQERLSAQNQGQSKVQVKEEELEQVAEIMGLSSIKYYDLKQNRTQNYTFDFDKMLDPNGNTGVYLIYSYVRIKSILRKAGYDVETSNLADFDFTVSNDSER